ncbi:MAG: enoyl-CoA hydratase/isomerase family protein, partial [Myxococcota bacterium]
MIRVAAGEVTTLTLDRPQVRNALDLATIDALHAALDDARDARVVVLTGAGDKVFCAGADLAEV